MTPTLQNLFTQDFEWVDQILQSSTEQPDPNNPSPIRYRIAHQNGEVCVTLWEPAELTDDRSNPYFYIANYRVKTEAMAHQIVQQYISAYRAMHPLRVG